MADKRQSLVVCAITHQQNHLCHLVWGTFIDTIGTRSDAILYIALCASPSILARLVADVTPAVRLCHSAISVMLSRQHSVTIQQWKQG